MRVIELPCQPHCDLNWSRELALAKTGHEKILWYFNLGLEDPYFPLEDELRFAALALPLIQFTKDVWPLFQEQTLGLCLYRGPAVEFAMYFQMLAHKLPDETPIWLLFELEPVWSVSRALQLLSKEGYEHFTIATRGKSLPLDGYEWEGDAISPRTLETKTGIVFPVEQAASSQFDALLCKEPARVVFEQFLAEQWYGLDRLLVLSNYLTPQGKRMLQGFAAAGGEIIYYGN